MVDGFVCPALQVEIPGAVWYDANKDEPVGEDSMKKSLCILLALLVLLTAGCAAKPAAQETPETQLAQNVNGWTLDSEEESQPAEGVTYLERVYLDEESIPHRVYILLLDSQLVTLKTGTSRNGYEMMPVEKQTVKEHAQAAVAEGVNVLAAVNGDFFDIGSTYIPSGLSIKDGVVICQNLRNRPYCAVTKSGEYLIGRNALDPVDETTLDMAVGGSHVLVWEGEIQEFSEVDSFCTTAHPRTLSGQTADGKIILAVIDGRQPGFSVGAPLTQCAHLMRSLGAVMAINHDGGGSSTMIIRNGQEFEVKNSPSDGSLRKVFCSIQVVEKQ